MFFENHSYIMLDLLQDSKYTRNASDRLLGRRSINLELVRSVLSFLFQSIDKSDPFVFKLPLFHRLGERVVF